MGNTQACCSSDGGAHPASLWEIERSFPFRDDTAVSSRTDYNVSQHDMPREATPPPCDGTLIVNVVSCSGLPSLPSNKPSGKAPDTYIRLHLGSANQLTQQTALVERSCSPSFDESFEFRLAGGSSHAVCTLTVAAMLKSRISVRASNSMLGEAQVSVRDVFCGRWSERIGGEWELRDDFTRSVATQQRTHTHGSGSLGTVELQLRFRPDVPAGMGLTLLPRPSWPTAILPAHDGKAVQSRRHSSAKLDMQRIQPPSDGWLKVHIRSCTGLLPTSKDSADSFAMLSVGGGESVQTDVHYKTLSPRFDQEFDFFLDKGAPPGSCVLLIKIRSPTDDFLGELELQPCDEFAQSNWQRRVKREFPLTDRLNRAPSREKKKRRGEPCPCGTVALTLTFEPISATGWTGGTVADPWEGTTPARWRSGYVRPDPEARHRAEALRAMRPPPSHMH